MSATAHELELLTAPALSRLIEGGVSTVVVPFGSIENQDRHLAIGADAVLADVVGREVSRRLGAALAPTVRVGCAGHHMGLPGTLTLRAETLSELAIDLAGSLLRQGFTTVVLLSTHGGNRAALDEAVARVSSSRAVVCAPRGDVGPEPGAHSGRWLTSVLLAIRPDLVDLGAAGARLAAEVREANAECGRNHLERFIASIVRQVRN